MMQPLVCPQCGTTIPAEHINIHDLVAVCPNCSTVFNFSSTNQALEKAKHKHLTMPKRISVVEEDDRTIIAISWRKWGMLFVLLPFTVFWNGIMLIGIITALVRGQIGVIFPFSLHIAGGLFLLHQTLSQLLNRTEILLDGHAVDISTRPIPPRRYNRLDYDLIVGLYYKQKILTRRNGWQLRNYYTDNHNDFELYAVLTDGSDYLLMQSDDEQIAYYVGQRIKDAVQLPTDLERIDLTIGREI